LQRRAPRLYLEDIRGAIARISDYTSAGEEEFRSSELLQDAVLRQLLIVGEAVQHLPDDLLEREPGIQWERVVGMRNRIVHGYHKINMDVVWDTVERDLPALRAAVERLLQTPDLE
jgi:uncharacterized protein with HEPN domain